jgi:hypothetical protein
MGLFCTLQKSDWSLKRSPICYLLRIPACIHYATLLAGRCFSEARSIIVKKQKLHEIKVRYSRGPRSWASKAKKTLFRPSLALNPET